MSLFMNNRLIVSKQYQSTFWFSKYRIVSILFRFCRLLELNGCRRLTGAIIEHAVHMLDLIDDAAGDSAQNIPGHIMPVLFIGITNLHFNYITGITKTQ